MYYFDVSLLVRGQKECDRKGEVENQKRKCQHGRNAVYFLQFDVISDGDECSSSNWYKRESVSYGISIISSQPSARLSLRENRSVLAKTF